MVCKQHFQKGGDPGTVDIFFAETEQGTAPHQQKTQLLWRQESAIAAETKNIGPDKWTPAQDLVAFSNWRLTEVPVITSQCCCH